MPCGMTSILSLRHVVNGAKEGATLLRHDDELCRSIDDPAHHVALGGCRLREHGMKCGHNWHFQTRKQLDDIASGFAAENPVLMLKTRYIEVRVVQKLGRLCIIFDHVVANLKAYVRGIVIDAARVCHGNDARVEIRSSCSDRPMQVMREGCDSAATRQVIADECHALKLLHFVLSKWSSEKGGFSRARRVATRASCERLCVDCTRQGETPQQVSYRTDARVCQETDHAGLADSDVDAIQLREDGVGCGNVERADNSMPTQDQKPGLPLRIQAPS